MNEKLPNIYNYYDVKKYLRDYRDARKKIDEGFTNLYICYELGQKNSKGYFNNVINGRVRIGSTLVDRFVKLLDLRGDELNYFRILVQYSQARTPEERDTLFEQLMRSSKIEGKELSLQVAQFYGEWYHSVIRALLDICDFNGNNFDVLRDRMITPISLPQLKNSIKLLDELGLIRKSDEGIYRPTDAVITSGSDIDREILLRFQEKTLNHGRDVVINSEVKPQKITTMTISVSKKTFETIQDRMTQLKHEIRALAQNDESDSEDLYQVAMHLYPHTE